MADTSNSLYLTFLPTPDATCTIGVLETTVTKKQSEEKLFVPKVLQLCCILLRFQIQEKFVSVVTKLILYGSVHQIYLVQNPFSNLHRTVAGV